MSIREPSDIIITGFSPTYFFQYRNKKCQCQMSDIAEITVDVDAQLCPKLTPAVYLAGFYKDMLLRILSTKFILSSTHIRLTAREVLGSCYDEMGT